MVEAEEGSIRYQLYYRDGCEQQANRLLAEGLAAFLQQKGPSWDLKVCNVTNIEPVPNEGNWGAIRIDIAVYSLSALIGLRKTVKAQVAASRIEQQQVRTTKPMAKSNLFTLEAEPLW